MNDANPKIVPLPGQTTDDGKGQADSTATDVRAESIKQRAGKVLSRFGVTFRKGPGRPRNDGTPGKADEILSHTPLAAPAPGTVVGASLDPSLDADFIEDCLKATTQAVVDFGNSKLKTAAVRATGGDKNFAAALIDRTNPSDAELARVAKLERILIKKYGIDVRYLPEFALCACVIGIGTRYMTALSELKQFSAPDHETNIVKKMEGQ